MLTGSCHCGAVKFQIEAPISELTTCDCSLCVKRNAVMAKVPEEALTVLEGEDLLTLYQWNTRRAQHYFCGRCGIYVFHRKRAAADHFDASSVPVRATEGATMTVEDPAGRAEWPGPRRLTNGP